MPEAPAIVSIVFITHVNSCKMILEQVIIFAAKYSFIFVFRQHLNTNSNALFLLLLLLLLELVAQDWALAALSPLSSSQRW
jgi:hypothetical protein